MVIKRPKLNPNLPRPKFLRQQPSPKQLGVGVVKFCRRCGKDLTNIPTHQIKEAIARIPGNLKINKVKLKVCMECYQEIKDRELFEAKKHDKELNEWAHKLGKLKIADKKTTEMIK